MIGHKLDTSWQGRLTVLKHHLIDLHKLTLLDGGVTAPVAFNVSVSMLTVLWNETRNEHELPPKKKRKLGLE